MPTIQLPLLFPYRPDWWAPADADVAVEYVREDERVDCPVETLDPDDEANADAWERWAESLHPRAEEYRCRNCGAFESHDGNEGFCLARFVQSLEEFDLRDPADDLIPFGTTSRDQITAMGFFVKSPWSCEEYRPRS